MLKFAEKLNKSSHYDSLLVFLEFYKATFKTIVAISWPSGWQKTKSFIAARKFNARFRAKASETEVT